MYILQTDVLREKSGSGSGSGRECEQRWEKERSKRCSEIKRDWERSNLAVRVRERVRGGAVAEIKEGTRVGLRIQL